MAAYTVPGALALSLVHVMACHPSLCTLALFCLWVGREGRGGENETGVQAGAAEAADPPAPLLGPVPLVAIPIIAGIGSEVTPMATILDDDDPLEPEKVFVHESRLRFPCCRLGCANGGRCVALVERVL